MNLVEIGKAAGLSPAPDRNPEIHQVTCDSREVIPGALFFAVSGQKTEGARFAAMAVAQGAVAIVAEHPIEGLPPEVVLLRASNVRRAMALAAAAFHGRPAQSMTLLGVTGTNGKTTTTYLIESMLKACGEPFGIIGTVSYRFAGREIEATHTTPESTHLQSLLAQMRREGVGTVAMEVSSHALAQERVAGLSFSSAAFTNLTRDHLDYHGDVAHYFEAKRRLFFELCAGPSIVNVDDPHGVRLADDLCRDGRTVWGFTRRGEGAELFIEGATFGLDGISGTLVSPAGRIPIHSPLVGLHNLENILCAAGLVLAAGFPLEGVRQGLAELPAVPGRLERVGRSNVFVDYAHTDDALTRALAALRPYTPGRLRVVFGCGGDRDPGKRPMMGEAAGRGADQVIVTSDNPRTEAPGAIVEAILPGLHRSGRPRLDAKAFERGEEGYVVELDRARAIEQAVRVTRPSDLLLVAGKGHEPYQIVGTEKRPFDDREEVRRALTGAGIELIPQEPKP